MHRQGLVSIDATTLYKGQAISGELAWDYFITRRQETFQGWLLQHGDEATAKAARLSLVLQRVMQWLERDRNQAGLPPLMPPLASAHFRRLPPPLPCPRHGPG